MRKVRLGDVLTFQRGYDLTHKQMNGGDVAVVGSSEIIGWHNQAKVKSPALLIGRSGTVGRPQYYEQDIWAHNTTLFVTDFHGNDPKFAFYFLRNLNLEDYANSSGVPTLNRNFIHPLIVSYPELLEQEKIVRVLSVIDSKIGLNNKTNSELEAIVRSLYDYWFVQYDFPDESGRPYKFNGGEMVWSEELKREVPKGWEVGKLGEFVSMDRGISYTSKDIADDRGLPMINLASIDTSRNYRTGTLKFFSGGHKSDKLVRDGDMLIACTDLTRNADIIGCPVLVPKEFDEYLYSMDLTKITASEDLVDMFLYESLRTDFYHNYIKYFASGTNVLHLDLNGINWYEMPIPPVMLQQKFANIVRPLRDKQHDILNENQELVRTRDFLLPMLMNGQVAVS